MNLSVCLSVYLLCRWSVKVKPLTLKLAQYLIYKVTDWDVIFHARGKLCKYDSAIKQSSGTLIPRRPGHDLTSVVEPI